MKKLCTHSTIVLVVEWVRDILSQYNSLRSVIYYWFYFFCSEMLTSLTTPDRIKWNRKWCGIVRVGVIHSDGDLFIFATFYKNRIMRYNYHPSYTILCTRYPIIKYIIRITTTTVLSFLTILRAYIIYIIIIIFGCNRIGQTAIFCDFNNIYKDIMCELACL